MSTKNDNLHITKLSKKITNMKGNLENHRIVFPLESMCMFFGIDKTFLNLSIMSNRCYKNSS